MSNRVSCPIPSLWYTVMRWTPGIEAYSTWDSVGHPFSVFDFDIHKGSPKVPLDSRRQCWTALIRGGFFEPKYILQTWHSHTRHLVESCTCQNMASSTVDCLLLLMQLCCKCFVRCCQLVQVMYHLCLMCVCVNAVQQLNTAISIHPAGMAKLCTFHQSVI